MNELLTKAVEFVNLILAQLFTKLIVAVVILLIGFVIARIIGKLVQRLFNEIELNNILKKAGVKFDLENTLSNFIVYFLYFVTIIWSLNALGLTTTILNMISGAFLVLIIISVILAVKDFVPNLIAGFFIYRKNLIKTGDKIKIDKLSGRVKKITLIETEIRTGSGDIIHIPNSTLTKKEIIIKKK